MRKPARTPAKFEPDPYEAQEVALAQLEAEYNLVTRLAAEYRLLSQQHPAARARFEQLLRAQQRRLKAAS